jgi:hypothetical protein
VLQRRSQDGGHGGKLFNLQLSQRTALVPLFDSKGRVRRDHVRVQGRDEAHPEGGYFIEWREQEGRQ